MPPPPSLLFCSISFLVIIYLQKNAISIEDSFKKACLWGLHPMCWGFCSTIGQLECLLPHWCWLCPDVYDQSLVPYHGPWLKPMWLCLRSSYVYSKTLEPHATLALGLGRAHLCTCLASLMLQCFKTIIYTGGTQLGLIRLSWLCWLGWNHVRP